MPILHDVRYQFLSVVLLKQNPQAHRLCPHVFAVRLVRENPKTPKLFQRRCKIWKIERNHQLKIYLSGKEKELFKEKMKLAKCRTMSHFIRKCVMEKEIYEVDLQPFRDLQGLLSNATNSLNQIAKRVNQTGIIYRDDIEDMKKSIERFSKELWSIHSLLLKRTKEISEN